MRVEDIAKVCHEVNRAYCNATGDSSQVAWEDAADWQRESAIKGVMFAVDNNASPEDLHQSWLREKEATGWVYGELKDEIKKTHPCMVPYHELPASQRVKDYLFKAVVSSLGEMLNG